MSVLKYWKAPNSEEKISFFSVEPTANIIDNLAGIIIIASKKNEFLLIQGVSCLSRNLPEILEEFKCGDLVYFHAGSSEGSDAKCLSKKMQTLTNKPVVAV